MIAATYEFIITPKHKCPLKEADFSLERIFPSFSSMLVYRLTLTYADPATSERTELSLTWK